MAVSVGNQYTILQLHLYSLGRGRAEAGLTLVEYKCILLCTKLLKNTNLCYKF